LKIIVIGSGVVGASAAYNLARSGAHVMLIDSSDRGRATSAGAGIVCPWSSRVTDRDWYAMASAGAEYYPRLREMLSNDSVSEFGYRQVGSLRLTSDDNVDEDFELIRRRVLGSSLAGEVSVISGTDAKSHFPPLEHKGPVIHIPGAARLDGAGLRAALREGAQRHGAKFLDARARIVAQDHVEGVDVEGEFFPADTVIEATGAWAPQLLEPLGLSSPVRPQRGQIIHLGIPDTDTRDWSVLLPMSSHYLLAFDDSRVVVGATRETNSGFDYRLTAEGIHEVLHEALNAAPGLAKATYLETRIGFRPVGPDIKPLLGELMPGLITANGLGASGLTMGPFVGAQAAALALAQQTEIDLAAYDPRREADGNHPGSAISA
jgi:D-amino-acid dehydrogenase